MRPCLSTTRQACRAMRGQVRVEEFVVIRTFVTYLFSVEHGYAILGCVYSIFPDICSVYITRSFGTRLHFVSSYLKD